MFFILSKGALVTLPFQVLGTVAINPIWIEGPSHTHLAIHFGCFGWLDLLDLLDPTAQPANCFLFLELLALRATSRKAFELQALGHCTIECASLNSTNIAHVLIWVGEDHCGCDLNRSG